MNCILKLAGGVAIALALAYAGPLEAAPREGAAVAENEVTFFLADPELGVAGVYRVAGTELYFEARRATDPVTGAPGALSLRVVDAEARTLAQAGEPFAEHWLPAVDELPAKSGAAYADLLAGLGEALEAADLHAALTAEKAALADLATLAAGTPTTRLPLRSTVGMTKVAADVNDLADFYARTAKNVRVDRGRDGVLTAKLGNGITLLSSQQRVDDEPGPDGTMGRVDGYAMVKAADGYVLAAELGGDNVPDGWQKALDAETQRDHHALAADFGRAATALNALAYSGKSAHGLAVSHRGEQEAMQRLAQTMVTHLLPVRDEASQEAIAKSYGLYQTYIQVWRKPFVVIAEHSGTRVGKWKYASSTSWTKYHQGWISYCNHGACAASDGMTYKCAYTGPRLGWYRTPVRYSGAGGHTCATAYWAVGWTNHHNCHDDSSVQVRAVRGQSYSTYGGRCSDGYYYSHAPTCDWQ